jgi:hypothetical protein
LITSLAASVFQNLPALTDVTLNNNLLTTLPSGLFTGSTNLVSLYAVLSVSHYLTPTTALVCAANCTPTSSRLSRLISLPASPRSQPCIVQLRPQCGTNPLIPDTCRYLYDNLLESLPSLMPLSSLRVLYVSFALVFFSI